MSIVWFVSYILMSALRNNMPAVENLAYCGQTYISSPTEQINIRGCTIQSTTPITPSYLGIDIRRPTLVNFKDSVLYFNMLEHCPGIGHAVPVSALDVNLDWVVTSSSSLSILSGAGNYNNANTGAGVSNISATNMQYGWEPSVSWPSYSADKEEWAFSALGDGITLTGSGEW